MNGMCAATSRKKAGYPRESACHDVHWTSKNTTIGRAPSKMQSSGSGFLVCQLSQTAASTWWCNYNKTTRRSTHSEGRGAKHENNIPAKASKQRERKKKKKKNKNKKKKNKNKNKKNKNKKNKKKNKNKRKEDRRQIRHTCKPSAMLQRQTRTHTRTHARTHARTQTQQQVLLQLVQARSTCCLRSSSSTTPMIFKNCTTTQETEREKKGG